MPRPIRVAVLATTIEFGGIERVLLTLLQHMKGPVEIVPVFFTRTDATETSFMERLSGLGVSYDTIFVNASRLKYLNPVRNIRDTVRILRKYRIDLIHTHGYRADVIGLVAARWFRLPIVSTCHGFISNDLHLSLYNRLDAFMLRYFTRVIAVSARMKEDLVAAGVDANKIQVITNAVASVPLIRRNEMRTETRASLGIRDNEFVFGFVGRLSDEKGPDFLLAAAARLGVQDGAWRLLMVGDGPLRARLEKTAADLGLNGKVEFVGFQSDTSRWYSAMDAFVLPSLTEGTPMALLEAMAHRVPVIATAVGGVPSVLVNERNGLLVPPGNPQKLFEAMRTVTMRPALRDSLSDAGQRSVRERYDVDGWVQKIQEFYMTAIDARASQT